MGYPAGWITTYLLVLSVNLPPVFQSFSEVVVDRGAWGRSGTCSLQGPMDRTRFSHFPGEASPPQ